MGERMGNAIDLCPRCGDPLAKESDWDRYGEDEGDHLCWEGPTCRNRPVDWVGRALAAEVEMARLARERDEACAEVERERAAVVWHLRALAGDDRFPWTESERDHALRSAADDIEAGEHREGR